MIVESDGVTLHLHERGEGQPVILIHPGPGLDGSVFFPWFERLEQSHRLLAVDLPGNGRSDRKEPADWTVQKWARDAKGLAESLGLETYTLLGHSFGARVALQHAVDFPGHAARLVISGGVAHSGAFDHLDHTFESFGTPELRRSVERAFEREETVQTPEECHAAWAEQMPFFMAEPDGAAQIELEKLWRSVAYSPEIHRHGSFGDFDVRAQLQVIKVPALVITGAEDRITRPEESRAIAGPMPNAHLEIVEGAGHFPFAEQPDSYFSALRGWLDQSSQL
ncbi:MAG: alpha/beta hydrolase [Actinobacteria bacterium]|nr:alpha/beta hydrolase [Actinomycetota bacterium]